MACGFCFNCSRGLTNACLTVHPEQAGGAYGYASMGPYRGGSAEYLRVPFADLNCLTLPCRSAGVRQLPQADAGRTETIRAL